MSPDLHPEELFDKAARGELTVAEQAVLSAHLAQCVACRFEHQVAADFAAVPMPTLNIDKLVSNALLARSSENLRRRPARRYGALLAAAVTLVAMASFAAVGQLTGVLPRLISAMTAPAAPKGAPVKTAQRGAARVHLAPIVAERGDDEISAPPVVEAPPPPPPQPAAQSATGHGLNPLELTTNASTSRRGLSPSSASDARQALGGSLRTDASSPTRELTSPSSDASGPRREVAASQAPRADALAAGFSRSDAAARKLAASEPLLAPEPSSALVASTLQPGAAPDLVAMERTPEIPAVVASASQLFAAANRARLEGDRPFAMAKYGQLLATYPASPEATQTQATLGRLLLDQGYPAGALQHLDAYLAGGDLTLREDVLSTRAQTLMRLGRSLEEGQAWRELLERYPSSIHAPRARERLQTLAGRP